MDDNAARALRWLDPVLTALPDLTDRHSGRLLRLENDLTEVLTAADHHTTASMRLLAVRRRMAERGRTTSTTAEHTPATAVAEVLAGFVCGFHDLDLRDAVGAGHGRMILRHGTDLVRRRWASRLGAGDLVGIAATERHGGSRLQGITTRATPMPGGGWALDGEKCWVSRLREASAFVVFFKDPADRMSAAVIDADAPGIQRRPALPAGLAGWAWGSLSLTGVRIGEADLLGALGDGLAVFREHFAAFRPLAAATALGTAAGIHAQVTATLTARVTSGILPRLRDTALVTLGRTHAELNAALLAATASARLTAAGHPQADTWSRSVKATAVDAANKAVGELSLLVGASGFQTTSALAKARADLGGLLYADGIHDSLLRSVGRTLTTAASIPAQRSDPVAGERVHVA
ncbi:acyl-CoA dehydrogenase family protein [Actinacidiphila yeochonensis]|uniref:acyl-CoA dehydrogenase family protein n=1 Tax=Actinacidiphila yeochonensis TaxID=89050 RepID=UPI00068997C0|nr:acyl-CoA dehydrogenase family protein [Actinacidiphila yeochonensis]